MKRWLVCLIFLILAFYGSYSYIFAIDCEDSPPTGDPTAINQYIDSCKAKINSLQNQQQTLQQVLTTLNSKIRLAQGQINQTTTQISLLEKDVTILSGVLDTVNESMDKLATIYIARVKESYMRYRHDPFDLLFSSQSFSDFFSKFKYLNTVKSRDQIILSELEKSRLDYNRKKDEKVKKQQEVEKLQAKLESQKKDLDGQQTEKQNLLVLTQNDEKKYQSLLSKAKAELEAIEAVIAGKGNEVEVGDVKAGDVIAKVIQGASCNSSGEHLHFLVAKDGETRNPFEFLSTIDYENCSGPGSCSAADPFNPSGSWSWPLNPKISLFQGYGATWAINNTWVGAIYKFHNGIDIRGSSPDVKAVQDGKLYRGSYAGQNSCALKYVHLVHKDGGLDTYYLHVNYF